MPCNMMCVCGKVSQGDSVSHSFQKLSHDKVMYDGKYILGGGGMGEP